MITGRGIRNQGTITDLLFAREAKEVLEYNEMKFGSQSEIRIAQEFENRKILFFPLPLAVRADTDEEICLTMGRKLSAFIVSRFVV